MLRRRVLVVSVLGDVTVDVVQRRVLDVDVWEVVDAYGLSKYVSFDHAQADADGLLEDAVISNLVSHLPPIVEIETKQ